MIKSVYTPNALAADTHELWWVHTGSMCLVEGWEIANGAPELIRKDFSLLLSCNC